MTPQQTAQTALMILRVWTEQGSIEPLRVDVRQTSDLSRGLTRTVTHTDIDLALAAVRTFLESGRTVDASGSNGVG